MASTDKDSAKPAPVDVQQRAIDMAGDESSISGLKEQEKGTTTTPTAPASGAPVRTVSGVKWFIIVAAILSSTFLFALDNTVVADVQPQIVLQFDSISEIAWLSVAFIMAAVSTNLLYGQLYSQFLPKWLYIISVVVFEVGSAVCGAAPNMSALIIGRALCGLGGIGMYLGVMTLLAMTTTIQERPLYVAGIGVTWGLGTILGPVVGGAFTQSSATWRWAFYINLVVGAVVAPVYLFMLPSPDPRPGASFIERLSEVDLVGAPLMLGAIICFTMAINFGGVLYEWNSGPEIALFVVSGVLFIIFGIQQAFCIGTTPKRRIFPVDLVTGKAARTVVLMFCTTAAGGAGIFLPVYFIPLFFQFTRGDSPVQAAVRLLPFICTLVFVTLAQGAALSHPSGRFTFYMPQFLFGGLLATAGGALMYVIDADTSQSWVYGASALVGVGVGFFSQAGFSIAQASAPEEQHPVAASFIALGQTAGITFALAIGNAVFINGAENRLTDVLPSTVTKDQIDAAIAGLGGDFVGQLPPALQVRVLDAIVEAIRQPYILLIVAGSVVVLASIFMKRERLFLQAAAIGV